VVFISISIMIRDIEHFFMCFLVICTSFENFSSVHLPISSLSHWYFGSLILCAPYKFWLLIPCQMSSWQTFFPILWAASSVW
jgi:hypothetical protein